jgi:L-ascorbate metabolism protein UlaG (beta-lactamase superfamily)
MLKLASLSLALAFTIASAAHAADARAAAAAPAPAAATTTAPAAAKKTDVQWWGHAAFLITTPAGAIIAVDPWLKNPNAPKGAAWPTKLDAILITHGHGDHVGDAVELAKKTGAQIIGSYELVGLLGGKAPGGNIGGTFTVKDAQIHLVPAVHSSGFGSDDKHPVYGGPAMGYVIEVQDGARIYHAGDTDVFGDMELIRRRYAPTVALLPIGGHFTMDPKGAALAASMLGVKTVIPMHFGTFPMLAGTPEQLSAAIGTGEGKATVQALKPGEHAQF